MATTLSQQLRSRIKRSGLTQMQLSGLSGIPQTTIGRFLRGGDMTIEKADKLQLALDGISKTSRRTQSATEEPKVEETAGA
jgi:transcriptional regulator with XRE-family HTH domain